MDTELTIVKIRWLVNNSEELSCVIYQIQKIDNTNNKVFKV